MNGSDPDITSAVAHWREVAGAVLVPHSEAEYSRLVAVLDKLIDKVGEDESHPLRRREGVYVTSIEAARNLLTPTDRRS